MRIINPLEDRWLASVTYEWSSGIFLNPSTKAKSCEIVGILSFCLTVFLIAMASWAACSDVKLSASK